MFAERTNWGVGSNRLAALAERLRGEHRAVLDLTETNPTRCGFRYFDQAPEAALAQFGVRAYAPDARGLPETRAAISGYYRAQGAAVDPVRLLMTAGTSEGYSHLMRLLCNPGEALLVPSPSYPLLDLLARVNDVRLIPYPLHHDGRWWLDVDALRAAADATCRAIVVISPNNPTGSFLKDREREALVTLARESGLAIIADEVFADYRVADTPDAAGTFAGEKRVLSFALNGVSKMLGLPQMKLAWIVANGPEAQVAEACQRLEVLADTYLSVGIPAQVALPVWLARRAGVQAEILERLRENFAVARTLRVAQCLPVEGGWCAVLRIPRTGTDEDFAVDLLQREGVLVDPGSLFDFANGGHVVVSLLAPPEIFAEGLRRLDAQAGL